MKRRRQIGNPHARRWLYVWWASDMGLVVDWLPWDHGDSTRGPDRVETHPVAPADDQSVPGPQARPVLGRRLAEAEEPEQADMTPWDLVAFGLAVAFALVVYLRPRDSSRIGIRCADRPSWGRHRWGKWQTTGQKYHDPRNGVRVEMYEHVCEDCGLVDSKEVYI